MMFSKQQPLESQTAKNKTKPSLAIIAVMFVVVFLCVAGVATPSPSSEATVRCTVLTHII